ncbi:MAG: protein kinase, partial [Myxococcales bacterium]|nr:protein kinase [Myxococcales bacterium]
LHGQPLSEVLYRASQRGCKLDWDMVAWVGAKVADALGYAHDLRDDDGKALSIVHRDVSPHNIFVTYDGHIKLIDFGVARAIGRLAETGHGRLKGKFRYMAPEQVTSRDFDHRVDLFALGASLYESLAGEAMLRGDDEVEVLNQLIFGEAPDLASVFPELPDRAREVFGKMLSREAETRYQTGHELSKALRELLPAETEVYTARWTELLAHLFPGEIVARSEALRDLKEDIWPASLVPPALVPGLDVTAHEVDAPRGSPLPSVAETSGFGASSASGRWGLIAGIVAGVALVVAGVWWSRSQAEPVPAGASVPSEITLDLSVQPPVKAEIRVDGRLIENRPPRVQLPRSEAKVKVRVKAPGFRDAELEVIPDRDVFLVVPLVAAPSADAPPEPGPDLSGSSAASAEVPSSKPQNARPKDTHKPNPKPTAAPAHGPLVTDNPF